MTGNIFRMHGDPHREALALLPWLVTEQLDAADRARVEQHLDGCADCRAALLVERQLDREIAQVPMSVDAGWAGLRQQLELGGRAEARAAWRRPTSKDPATYAPAQRWPVSWRIGVPLGVAAAMGLAIVSAQVPATFAALGAAPKGTEGNIVIIFRPDTSEAVFRQTLRTSAARLVDGPTAANAYVLAVPPTDRSAAIDRLRQQQQVVLAEPVDGAPAP